MFLWTYRHFPKVLVIIPLIWSFIGFMAAFSLGMVEDTTLIVTGIIASAMLIFRKMEWTKVAVIVAFTVVFLQPVLAQQTYPVTFVHDGLTVNGTFTTPIGTGPFPTIVINPGTGANDRNGTIPVVGGNFPCLYPHLVGDTLRPYKQLGDALTDSGYAVLRYDKLEFTYHPSALAPITFHKLWLPVESAIDYVKTRDDVDTNRIVLIGHSEGSSLIPFIAKERSDIAALISLGGPRSPLDTLLADQLRFITRECNGDTIAAEFQVMQILAYFEVIRTNMWNILTPSLFGVPASAWYDYIRTVDSVAINYNLNSLPTLFIGFGLDINVPPSELDRLQQEVTITDDFWRLPDLVHFMTTSDEPDVPMALTDTIVYWLRQNVQTGVDDHGDAFADFVHVSPNPFHTELNILIDPISNAHCDLSIINSEGSIIYSEQLLGNTARHMLSIDLSFAPAGTYYVEVLNEGARSVEKVIKLK
jgi:hypothetical protein